MKTCCRETVKNRLHDEHPHIPMYTEEEKSIQSHESFETLTSSSLNRLHESNKQNGVGVWKTASTNDLESDDSDNHSFVSDDFELRPEEFDEIR